MQKRKKSQRGQPWTNGQVKTLRSSRKEPAKLIAKKLGRTEGAIRSKAHSVGISLGSKTTTKRSRTGRRR